MTTAMWWLTMTTVWLVFGSFTVYIVLDRQLGMKIEDSGMEIWVAVAAVFLLWPVVLALFVIGWLVHEWLNLLGWVARRVGKGGR